MANTTIYLDYGLFGTTRSFLCLSGLGLYLPINSKQSRGVRPIALGSPSESPGTIGIIKRYHATLRVSFTRISSDMDECVSDQDCLKMAVFALNSTIGREVLCPMLLVFGSIPRPARSMPEIYEFQLGLAVEKAAIAVEKEQARRRLNLGLAHPSGANGEVTRIYLERMPTGSPVLVIIQGNS